MARIDPDTLSEQAKVYNALSHPTRLMVIHRISEGEFCVSDLAKFAGVDLSTMSRHLEVLKQAGIVEGKKVKNQVFYRVKFKCVLKFFDCIQKSMVDR